MQAYQQIKFFVKYKKDGKFPVAYNSTTLNGMYCFEILQTFFFAVVAKVSFDFAKLCVPHR